MNLVAFSIRTKGAHSFTRRLGTVFTRFGVSENPIRRALHSTIDSLRPYGGAPTFFIPAVVLDRHPALISEIVHDGAEVGVHGYVHNDYRTLSKGEQYKQTEQAILVFQKYRLPFQGFRNPYLGWTQESLEVYTSLGFNYESNVAVLHDVVDLNTFSPFLRSSFAKSLELFQAAPCSIYALRPFFEGALLRIPTNIPDDEMLFDRLRLTDQREVGHIWSRVMQRIYDRGGLSSLDALSHMWKKRVDSSDFVCLARFRLLTIYSIIRSSLLLATGIIGIRLQASISASPFHSTLLFWLSITFVISAGILLLNFNQG